MRRIGLLTAGGDTPALNATIHGAVTRASAAGVEVYGLIKGFNCLFNPRVPHVHLNPLYQDIPELDPTKGGTLIGSSRDFVDPEKKDDLDPDQPVELHDLGEKEEGERNRHRRRRDDEPEEITTGEGHGYGGDYGIGTVATEASLIVKAALRGSPSTVAVAR